MFNQAAVVALRILLFRAGPQDFPYSPQLAWPVPVAAIAAYTALFSVLFPPVASVIISAVIVAALALVVRSLLAARGLLNRHQQTLNALLASGIPLTLASIPPLVAMAPLLERVAANPELLNQPGALEGSPLASAVMNLLNFWSFAVYANVLRHALNTSLWIGPVIALFVAFTVLLLCIFFAQVLFAVIGTN